MKVGAFCLWVGSERTVGSPGENEVCTPISVESSSAWRAVAGGHDANVEGGGVA